MADITRKDWVAKTGEEQVAIADAIFAKLNKASKYAYQQGYTNSFIGVRSGAKPCNFFTVIPQKKAALLSIRVQQSAENDKLVEQVSKSGVKYTNGWYAISFASAEGLDVVIPILLQAEAEFKKEKGENALTLHEDVVEETNSTAPAEVENLKKDVKYVIPREHFCCVHRGIDGTTYIDDLFIWNKANIYKDVTVLVFPKNGHVDLKRCNMIKTVINKDEIPNLREVHIPKKWEDYLRVPQGVKKVYY